MRKFDDWEISNAAETLKRAKEIMADKEKMKAVNKFVDKEIATLQKVKTTTSKTVTKSKGRR